MQLQLTGIWLEERCEEINKMVRRAPFARALYDGNEQVMKMEVARFWNRGEGFVPGFNKWIEQRIPPVVTSLSRIPTDEKSHSELWVKMGDHLHADLNAELDWSISHGVDGLCDMLRCAEGWEFWAGCLGTEEFAVSLATYLTESERFMQLMGDSADWMIEHTKMHMPSHSDCFAAGIALCATSHELDLDSARETILKVPRRFIELANLGVL